MSPISNSRDLVHLARPCWVRGILALAVAGALCSAAGLAAAQTPAESPPPPTESPPPATAPEVEPPLSRAPTSEPVRDETTAEPAAAAPEPAAAEEAGTPGEKTDSIARELFDRGKERWKAGDCEQAIALLLASQQRVPVAAGLALIGDCQEKLGKLQSASETYRRAALLAVEQGVAGLARRVETRRAALAPRIPHLVFRVVQPSPPRLVVSLNDVELAGSSLSAPRPLDAGLYRGEARASGYLPLTFAVQLKNDSPPLDNPHVVDLVLRPDPEARPLDRRELGLWTGAVGLAALATSGILAIVAKNADDASCRHDPGGGRDICPRHAYDERQKALDLARVATYFGLGGIALIGTGVTFYVTAPHATEALPSAAGVRWDRAF